MTVEDGEDRPYGVPILGRHVDVDAKRVANDALAADLVYARRRAVRQPPAVQIDQPYTRSIEIHCEAPQPTMETVTGRGWWNPIWIIRKERVVDEQPVVISRRELTDV